MSPRWRLGMWLALLAGSAALIAYAPRQPADADLVEAAVPSGRPARDGNETKARPEAASAQMIAAIRPRNPAERIGDSFTPHDWTPPQPKAVPQPAPRPTAPPLPFVVLGKKLEDGSWQVFLARENQVFLVKAQDTIEGTYRIDDIRPPVMTLTYLPLNERQTLPIGAGE